VGVRNKEEERKPIKTRVVEARGVSRVSNSGKPCLAGTDADRVQADDG